jgi:pimeloyl-ACP methyl ester carboxylesterase
VGDVHALVGHSLGGTAAVYARARRNFGRRIITIASPLHPRDFLAEFGRTLKLSARALEGVKELLGARYGLNFVDLDLRLVTPRLAAEALVMHDLGDREVPHEHGLELFRHWPSAELFTTDGLGHRRILKAPEVIAKVVEVIAGTRKLPTCEELLSAELFEPELRAS